MAEKKWKKKRVLVFGVFDLLHPGHRAFLREARMRGNELVVVVARDSAVKKLKRYPPHCSERERARRVRKLPFVARAVLGDRTQGSYAVLRRLRPDCIALGYDQNMLSRHLRRSMKRGVIPRIPLFRIKAFSPRRFHTSLLRRRNSFSTRKRMV